MAENRNRTARRFSQRGNAPTAVAPADNGSCVPPPRSSATHRESPRSSALASTLAPASSLAVLPPLSIPASPAPFATARSGCLSPTSVGHALIRCQRALLHLRRALPQVNQDFALRSSCSQRDPLMMRRKRQHTVFALRFAVHRNPLAQSSIQIVQTVGFAPLQATQKIPPHVLPSRFHFSFRLRAIRPAQPRRETPVACEVLKHWVPHDLASLVRSQPHRLHAVVENLFRHSADLLERRFVQAQQRAQLLIQRCFRYHPAAVTQREGETV